MTNVEGLTLDVTTQEKRKEEKKNRDKEQGQISPLNLKKKLVMKKPILTRMVVGWLLMTVSVSENLWSPLLKDSWLVSLGQGSVFVLPGVPLEWGRGLQ